MRGITLRIALEVQLILDRQKTGISWLAENILMELSKISNDQFILQYFPFKKSLKSRREDAAHMKKYENQGFLLEPCRWFHFKIYRRIWNWFPIPYRLFFHQPSDVTLFFNYCIPPGVKGKKIVMIHDMAYRAYPETIGKRTMRMLQHNLKNTCQRADKVVTISEFSKKEIVKYLKLPPEKIVVMPCGVDHDLFRCDCQQEKIKAVKVRYGIDKKYFLYLGTLEPRKNIARLVEAYDLLKEECNEVPQLVIAGKKGWMYDEIFQSVEKFHLKDYVIFTDYVDEADLPALIKGAEAFLFPSLYEGFGLPPLEAMACGTPVMASNAASLPEVVGTAGILVDPYSLEEMKQGMKQLMNDSVLRQNLSRAGIERSQLFTWKKSAEILLEVFHNL